ncbi:hypothetical protein EVAR_4371_1 [Eumeta japonica]|uniref:Uncharacterized protein n=1 Tax=Eumeta variegata TaxID=151549 RepID=A0A4C1SXJ6_EUMVA|nr:hypothetical protein EVAR_4371_1 [Eumeta japonica]
MGLSLEDRRAYWATHRLPHLGNIYDSYVKIEEPLKRDSSIGIELKTYQESGFRSKVESGIRIRVNIASSVDVQEVYTNSLYQYDHEGEAADVNPSNSNRNGLFRATQIVERRLSSVCGNKTAPRLLFRFNASTLCTPESRVASKPRPRWEGAEKN